MKNRISGNELRKLFIDYFVSKQHRLVRSSNLVPSADPTLLFTNSGMVQFKDLFIGKETRDYRRAVTSQKCLRVSGKHNDLEEVGRTRRHNTFFEMLGNFSFGDYFKEDAIAFAWEFFTVVLKLPKEKLWITVYEKDDESAKIWQKIAGVPQDRIIALGEKDNFWSMGPTGPCGPCTEIHIDNGPAKGCGRPECNVACHCDRYEEIWNLVFMQYDRAADGSMTPLKKPCIDTGMGLERLASVMQDVDSNFDTDLIRPIIARAEEVLGKQYGLNRESDISFRVIGDHTRAAAFLITEGILPSNDDRGYVLRRLMRRAMRHGKMLGASEPFLYQVIGSVIDNFRETYPELREAEGTMAKIIKSEEERFGRTLEAGLKILHDIIAAAHAKKSAFVDGKEIFKLYDTYGFPLDLAGDVIHDSGLGFNKAEFDAELGSQREQARKGAKHTAAETPAKYKGLENEKTVFTGYATAEEDAAVKVLIKGDARAERLAKGDKGEIILDKSPFYAESGGQMGDHGIIEADSGMARVIDTRKALDMTVHVVEVMDGEFKNGQRVHARLLGDERAATRRNHTATHMLQAALRQVLGEHVKQAGSAVNHERLRFDFSHYTATTQEEVREVENIVNRMIREDLPVTTVEMDVEKAMDGGATALFGEKYGASVRVVEMPGFSKELCGGTHATSTGQIGVFKIIAESGVAAGIRRIEAVTGERALEYFTEMEAKLKEVSGMVKCRPEDAPDRVQKLLDKGKELEKTIKKLQNEKARGGAGGEAAGEEREVKGVKVRFRNFGEMDGGSLRELVDEMKVKIGSGVIAAGCVNGGKAAICIGVTKDLVGRLQAGAIVKEAAAITGGGGGGRPDMAQAGGPDGNKLDDALNAVFGIVEKMLG